MSRVLKAKGLPLLKRALRSLGLDVRRAHNIPERTLLGLRSHSLRTVIDIGANRGQFALYISELLPEVKLLCFEPLPGPFAQLEAWAKARPVPRPHLFNLALGDTEGKVEMFRHAEHDSSSSLLRSTETMKSLHPITAQQERVSVRLTTLDAAIAEAGLALEPEILVKLDVQGYEDRVIRGARDTLAAAKAVILEVNLDSLYEAQADFKDLMGLLYDQGYRYAGNFAQNHAEDGRVVFLDAVFTK